MIKVSVLPLDTFVVINKSMLNDQNRLSLTLLYQPIVGGNAISLYLTLWSYLNTYVSKECNHQDLINSLQMKLEDIVEAREKLEALGLIRTYLKKGDINNYVFELYNPLTAYDFINNPILNTALKNNVSKKEYQRIVGQYSLPKVDLKGYDDISCSFKDIFAFISYDSCKQENIRKASHLGLSFEPTINFNELLGMIPEEYLNYKSITKEMKEKIYQLAFIYDLNNENMSNILENSIQDRKINFSLLQDNCRNYYKFEHIGKIPTIVYNSQPISLRINSFDNTRRSKLIRQFETTNPYEYLTLKQGGSTPTINDLKIIEYLMLEQKLTPGVINVLIDYVLKINNNKLIKPFVEQVAAQWKRSNILTVSDAIDFAQSEYDSKNNKNTKVKENKPNWLDKKIVDDVLSAEELKEFERKLKGDKNA